MRIVKGSGGSMLCPPGHPSHQWHIEDGPRNDPSLYASLDYAVQDEYGDVPQSVKDKVAALLSDATLVESELWVKQVYGYFRGCYSPDGDDRNVSHAVIYSKDMLVLSPPEHHLACMLIRAYFPDHEPRLDLIENSVGGYGQKPCLKCEMRLQYEAKVDAFAEPITAVTTCPQGGVHEVAPAIGEWVGGYDECRYVLDGYDTDGTPWYECKTHESTEISPDAPCAKAGGHDG